MSSLKPLLTLIGLFALTGAVVPAYADTPDSEAVSAEVQVSAAFPSCEGLPARDASRLAREAEKNGAHQRAAECFTVAGENFRAHRAMVRATEGTTEAAKQKASIAANSAKDQLRRVKAAFR
jgi:hypothetical protein